MPIKNNNLKLNLNFRKNKKYNIMCEKAHLFESEKMVFKELSAFLNMHVSNKKVVEMYEKAIESFIGHMNSRDLKTSKNILLNLKQFIIDNKEHLEDFDVRVKFQKMLIDKQQYT